MMVIKHLFDFKHWNNSNNPNSISKMNRMLELIRRVFFQPMNIETYYDMK